jgi:hypothetical protein
MKKRENEITRQHIPFPQEYKLRRVVFLRVLQAVICNFSGGMLDIIDCPWIIKPGEEMEEEHFTTRSEQSKIILIAKF